MLYTLENSGNPKTTRSPSSSAFSVCVIQQAYGDPGTHAQLRQQDSEIKGSSGHMTAKERKYVAVTSVGLPGVVLWHVACPKLCCALPEASHLTRLWPGIINRHLALLSQESDSRPSAFSEVLAIGCSSCIGSSVRLAIPCTLTHLPSLFSQSSRASSQRFSPVRPFHAEIQCWWCCQFLVPELSHWAR